MIRSSSSSSCSCGLLLLLLVKNDNDWTSEKAPVLGESAACASEKFSTSSSRCRIFFIFLLPRVLLQLLLLLLLFSNRTFCFINMRNGGVTIAAREILPALLRQVSHDLSLIMIVVVALIATPCFLAFLVRENGR